MGLKIVKTTAYVTEIVVSYRVPDWVLQDVRETYEEAANSMGEISAPKIQAIKRLRELVWVSDGNGDKVRICLRDAKDIVEDMIAETKLA